MNIDKIPGKDAIAFLAADHQKVKSLFAEFDQLKLQGSAQDKAALIHQICSVLKVHAAIEEEIFYPAARDAIDDSDLMNEALAHHAGAKELVAELEKMNPHDQLYDAKVTVLRRQIEHHVKEVEAKIFPQVIKAKLDTAALGAKMSQRRAKLVSAMGNSSDALKREHVRELAHPNISPDPRKNQLLASLPPAELQRWLPDLEYVELRLGEVLYEAGGKLSHVYFPTTAIISLLYVMQNGESAEIAVVGNDGVLGIALFMGGDSTSSRALVQSAGGAYRLTAQLMKEEFDRGGPVLHLLLRYTQALITQMVQTAACNKHHSLDQQLCRWLLLSLDRLQGTEMVMTQALIAHMLGVPLAGATEGALTLQMAGLINYTQGRIRVLDRGGLEKRTCECYAVVKKEYDRLLPHELAA
jgi:CRP-like cAMP-binding protein/hemerythrin superfamily protein